MINVLNKSEYIDISLTCDRNSPSKLPYSGFHDILSSAIHHNSKNTLIFKSLLLQI